jgi:hypothetical protein
MTKEALRLALEALGWTDEWRPQGLKEEAITAIKAALEAKDGECKYCTDGCPACDARKLPEQEPVAYINVEQRKLEWAKYMSWDTPTIVNLPKIPLYTIPPQRTWVGLTDEELEASKPTRSNDAVVWELAVEWAEAKLKEKNNG